MADRGWQRNHRDGDVTRQEFRDWRTQRGLREKDVAEMFGLTETEVKQMEAGSKAIYDRLRRQVARVK